MTSPDHCTVAVISYGFCKVLTAAEHGVAMAVGQSAEFAAPVSAAGAVAVHRML